jgi:hypothetical protein
MTAKSDDSSTETRWAVLIAVIGVGGIYLALPDALVVGPPWLLLALVTALIVPAVAAHRTAPPPPRHCPWIHHQCHRDTLALVGSLVLLITSLPSKGSSPILLLRSAAVLWVTNVLVFALWYWRVDAGGPHQRAARRRHTAGAFFFPQMMQGAPGEHSEQWFPRFVDYFFVAFNTSTAFSPTDTPVLSRWAKVLSMLQALISLLIVAILASRAVGLL